MWVLVFFSIFIFLVVLGPVSFTILYASWHTVIDYRKPMQISGTFQCVASFSLLFLPTTCSFFKLLRLRFFSLLFFLFFIIFFGFSLFNPIRIKKLHVLPWILVTSPLSGKCLKVETEGCLRAHVVCVSSIRDCSPVLPNA